LAGRVFFIEFTINNAGKNNRSLMTAPEAFIALRDQLAEIYGNDISARRVAYDATLNVNAIMFTGNAQDTWHSILLEAENTKKLKN